MLLPQPESGLVCMSHEVGGSVDPRRMLACEMAKYKLIRARANYWGTQKWAPVGKAYEVVLD